LDLVIFKIRAYILRINYMAKGFSFYLWFCKARELMQLKMKMEGSQPNLIRSKSPG
jgi:hypothetical protein